MHLSSFDGTAKYHLKQLLRKRSCRILDLKRKVNQITISKLPSLECWGTSTSHISIMKLVRLYIELLECDCVTITMDGISIKHHDNFSPTDRLQKEFCKVHVYVGNLIVPQVKSDISERTRQ